MPAPSQPVESAVLSSRARRLSSGLVAGAAAALVFAVLAWARPGLLEGGERWTYDWRARRVAASQAPSSGVVLVDVDEEDLRGAAEAYGARWPWPRDLFGYLVQFASDAGARAVVIDWVFEEKTSAYDQEGLASAMRKGGRTVFGLSMPARLPLAPEARDGRWAAPLKRFSDRSRALEAAWHLEGWGVRAFLLPASDGIDLWAGGFEDAAQVEETFERLRGEELTELLSPLPPVSPRALDDRELALEPTIDAVLRERDSLPAVSSTAGFAHRELVPPLALLAGSAARLGNVLLDADPDGVYRRHQILVEHQGRLFPSLALAAAMVATGNEARLEGSTLVLGQRRFELDEEGQLPIRFARDDVERHHALKLLRSQAQLDAGEKPDLDPARLRGKIVVIAASAHALGDYRASPVARSHLGALINANVIDNLLTGHQVRRASRAVDALFAFGLALLFSLAVIGLGATLRSAWSALAGTALAVGLGLFGAAQLCQLLLARHGLWLALTTPAIGAVAATFSSLLATSAFERRDRRFVQEALGRYTSPVLVRELLAHPEYLSLEWGQVREISVFFSDIAGFTAFSEKLEPRRLVALLNDYLTNMTEIVLAHGGVVDKYIGDAIMAFWGAPLSDEEHARKAVLAALAMRRRCEELRPKWEAEYGPTIVARAGINTGLAVSGNMGSRHKFNYTVMGDTVNLASRLEGANKPYGTTLMISESCYAKVRDLVEVRELDWLAVKGKQKPVTVYEVLAEKGHVEPRLAAAIAEYHEGLRLYRARDFAAATRRFEQALAIAPDDGPSKTYVERCRHFLEQPPKADWDGVWRMKEK